MNTYIEPGHRVFESGVKVWCDIRNKESPWWIRDVRRLLHENKGYNVGRK